MFEIGFIRLKKSFTFEGSVFYRNKDFSDYLDQRAGGLGDQVVCVGRHPATEEGGPQVYGDAGEPENKSILILSDPFVFLILIRAVVVVVVFVVKIWILG